MIHKTYKKPNDITYTEMAIAIDNMMYSETCDDDLMFQYLYHLAFVLSVKNKFFKSNDYYDSFSIFVATRVFLRIKNEKQFIPDKNGHKMSKLKSSLNYLKSVLYPCKVDFEQENYAQTDISVDNINEDVISEFSFYDFLINSVDGIVKVEFNCYLEEICNTIKSFLYKLPYNKHSSEFLNIYMSCLLSILNSITLTNKQITYLNSLSKSDTYETTINYYDKNNNFVILYHLDNNMKQYIMILVNEIKKLIANDLSGLINYRLNVQDFNDVLIKKEINSNYSGEYIDNGNNKK